MAKIAIFEDDKMDLELRYSRILQSNQVHLYAFGPLASQMRKSSPDTRFESVTFEIPQGIPEADVYFTNGLERKCFDILARVPREKSYLISGDLQIREEGRNQGYSVLEPQEVRRIKEIVNQI